MLLNTRHSKNRLGDFEIYLSNVSGTPYDGTDSGPIAEHKTLCYAGNVLQHGDPATCRSMVRMPS